MIPAGLFEGVEVFVHKNELFALFEGKKIYFTELPEQIKDVFRAQLIKDKDALKGLKLLGIDDSESMLIKYVSCNFGGFDSIPDLINRNISKEFWQCSNWKNCPAYGLICKVPGKLTPRELEISILVSQGLQDIEIADKLNSCQSTIRTHLNHIYIKLFINNRIELMMWVQKNIIK